MYEIVVVGESMAGKSTWISSLIKDDYGRELKSSCEENESGQTKIATNYILEATETKPAVTYISWIMDEVEAEKNKEALKNLSKYFPIFSKTENLEQEASGFIKSEEYKKILGELDVLEFMKNVINNQDISSSGLIEAIDITVPASAKSWEVLTKYNQNKVKLRDTRGFIDETPEDMANMYAEIAKRYKNEENQDKSEEEKWLIDKLFNERGMAGADGIVFLGIEGSNALLKKNNKEIYGSLITKMLNSAPVFLTVRSDGLSGVYEDNEDIDYNEAIAKDEKGKYKYIKRFDGFENYKKLLSDFEKHNEDDVKANIAKRHYRELLLPKIVVDKDDIEDTGKWERIYRKASVAVFEEVIKEACEFNARYEEIQNMAAKLLNVLNFDLLETFKVVFDEVFKPYVAMYGNAYYLRDIGENHKTILRKLSHGYYGGLVGVRGGLTTYDAAYGEMVGNVAIDIMETGYRIRRDMYEAANEAVKPHIKKYAEKTHNSKEAVEKEYLKLLNLFRERFAREADSYTFSRYCTYTMLNQYFLERAFEKAEIKWKLRGAEKIEGCLPELDNLFSGEAWERYKGLISVLKDILWDMIEESINAGKERF
nr:hypothetical protein [uncultured Catonella sp.]